MSEDRLRRKRNRVHDHIAKIARRKAVVIFAAFDIAISSTEYEYVFACKLKQSQHRVAVAKLLAELKAERARFAAAVQWLVSRSSTTPNQDDSRADEGVR